MLVRGFRFKATYLSQICRFRGLQVGVECCNADKKGCQGSAAGARPLATVTSPFTWPFCRNCHPCTLPPASASCLSALILCCSCTTLPLPHLACTHLPVQAASAPRSFAAAAPSPSAAVRGRRRERRPVAREAAAGQRTPRPSPAQKGRGTGRFMASFATRTAEGGDSFLQNEKLYNTEGKRRCLKRDTCVQVFGTQGIGMSGRETSTLFAAAIRKGQGLICTYFVPPQHPG